MERWRAKGLEGGIAVAPNWNRQAFTPRIGLEGTTGSMPIEAEQGGIYQTFHNGSDQGVAVMLSRRFGLGLLLDGTGRFSIIIGAMTKIFN